MTLLASLFVYQFIALHGFHLLLSCCFWLAASHATALVPLVLRKLQRNWRATQPSLPLGMLLKGHEDELCAGVCWCVLVCLPARTISTYFSHPCVNVRLEDNRIGAAGCTAIAEALKQNQHLRSLG